jgi:hypothetical protein
MKVMNRKFVGGTAAMVLVGSMAAFAQTTGQKPTTSQTPTAQPSAGRDASAAGQQVTLTGCVQREADYRRAKDAGKGGVAGTGVGAGNEFVLVDASTSSGSGSGSTASSAGTAPGTATGTGGGAASGNAYELTGSNEGQAQQFVGKRVEITGMLKPGETTASGPTGGPTAGTPPRGVDVTSPDLKLRELEITSIRATSTGTCQS